MRLRLSEWLGISSSYLHLGSILGIGAKWKPQSHVCQATIAPSNSLYEVLASITYNIEDVDRPPIVSSMRIMLIAC